MVPRRIGYHGGGVSRHGFPSGVSEAADAPLAPGLHAPEEGAALKRDPFAYGVVANRTILETIARYSNEQGLTPRVLSLEEIFPAATLSL